MFTLPSLVVKTGSANIVFKTSAALLVCVNRTQHTTNKDPDVPTFNSIVDSLNEMNDIIQVSLSLQTVQVCKLVHSSQHCYGPEN